MTTLQVRQVQDDYSSGEVLDVQPQLIDPRGLLQAANGIYRDDGAVRRRGGSAYASAAFGTGGLRWVWTGYFAAGARTIGANTADFGVLDVDDTTWINLGGSGLSTPASAALIRGMLFISPGYIYAGSRKTANYTTGTISTTLGATTVIGTGTTWTTMIDAGSLIQVGDERIYVVASITDNTHLELSEPYEGTTAAGKSYTSYPLYPIRVADPYPASSHYAYSQQRLVYSDSNLIRFTEQYKPHSTLVNDYHELPEGQRVTGLCAVGGNVLVFGTAGIWLLGNLAFNIVDATGTPQHRFEMLSRELRLWQESGVAYWGQLAVVPTTAGIYLMDGISTPVPISRTVDPLHELYSSSGYRPGGAVVYRNHYFLPIIDSSGVVYTMRACRLDRGRTDKVRGHLYPWSRFDGSGANVTSLAVRTISDAEPVLVAANLDSRLHNCSAWLRPDAAHKNDADGTTFNLDVIYRDFTLADLAQAVLRFVRPQYDLIDAGSDHPTIIFEWGEGTLATGETMWDEFTWDDANWAGDAAGAEFFGMDCELGPSQGDQDGRCRVGKRRRHIRLRARSVGPSAACTLRSMELFIRPPGSARR